MRKQDEVLNFIYGAGNFGCRLLEIFMEIGVKVDYFVQTEEPTKTEIKGIPLVSCQAMRKIDADKNIFIAINDVKAVREINRKINQSKKIRLYDCRGIINGNGFQRLSSDDVGTGSKHCIICDSDLEKFAPAGIENMIFKRHHIIGGGYRDNCICPFCGSNDRHRWLFYVLKKKTDIRSMHGRILHFAPEKNLSKFICMNTNIDYYTGDIRPNIAMHITDITNIQYADEVFDYVICNHVMEHILDESRAISEVKRVMKNNGKLILSFPICTDMATFEDDNIVTAAGRSNAYGQEDHVRLYGTDYKERFEKYGFKINVFSPMMEFDKTDIEKYGFIPDDVIMIAEKSK